MSNFYVDRTEDDFDAANEQFAAQQEWFNEHQDCDEPTSDRTDDTIGAVLDARQIREFGPSGVRFSGSAADFRDAVKAGMDEWWRQMQDEEKENDRQAV